MHWSMLQISHTQKENAFKMFFLQKDEPGAELDNIASDRHPSKYSIYIILKWKNKYS